MKVAIYTRVSTTGQAEDGFSLEAQYDKLLEFVKINGWELLRVYTDPGVSAKNLDRPGVQEMIRDMKSGLFEAILVHKLDRLTRNISDLYDLVELVNKHSIKLISLSENIDTSTPMGRMFVYILGIFAQMYRENLREEVLKGMTKRAEKGLRNASIAPFGYRNLENTNELVIDPEQAEWVKKIFQWYTEKGWGFSRITKELNTLNISGNRGGSWHQNIVQYILSNPTYIGKVHWKPKNAPDRIIRDGIHEPIIDEVTFNKAQTIMKRRSLKEMSRSSRDAYPFSGIVKCGVCGSPYHGRILKYSYGSYYNYRCYSKNKKTNCTAPDISEMKLEKLLFEHMDMIADQIELGKNEAAVTEDYKEIEKERKRIERELTRSETRRKNWQYAFGDGKLPYEDYVKLMDEEMLRVESLRAELANMPEPIKEAPVTGQELIEIFRNLRSNWEFLEPATRKSMIQSLYKKITISHDGKQWRIVHMEPV